MNILLKNFSQQTDSVFDTKINFFPSYKCKKMCKLIPLLCKHIIVK